MLASNWKAHRVVRFHTHPILSRFSQTNADHAHGVASTIGLLNKDASANLLLAAIWHDAGEAFVGDLPYAFKHENADLAKQHRAIEAKHRNEITMPIALTDDERKWIKFADRLEALFFAATYAPAIVAQPEWVEMRQGILIMASDLGASVYLKTYEAITEMLEEIS